MSISPPSLLFKVVGPVIVIGLANVMLALFAWIVPERRTVPPVPLSVKGPARSVEEPAVRLSTPV